MKIWLYGFGSWGRANTNISEEVAGAVVRAGKSKAEVTKTIFKVRFEVKPFLDAAERIKPDYILGLGQYPRGSLMRIERRAVNEIKEQGTVRPIETGKEKYRDVNWLIEPEEGVAVTKDAGRFVCNMSMYILIGWAKERGVRYGFVHIPRQAGVRAARAFVKGIITAIPFSGKLF